MTLHRSVTATVWFDCENLRNLIVRQARLVITVRCGQSFTALRVEDKCGEWVMALSKAVTML
jgi:hypothetical protein